MVLLVLRYIVIGVCSVLGGVLVVFWGLLVGVVCVVVR